MKRLDIISVYNECKKVKYENQKVADIKAEIALEKREVVLRSYFCHKCKSYHLTSKNIIQQKNIVKRLEENKAKWLEKEAEYWIKRIK